MVKWWQRDVLLLKGAETNLYTYRFWLFSESLQICFRTLYFYMTYLKSKTIFFTKILGA